MGRRIDCYFDLASFYSYVGFLDLQRNRDLLASHGVEVEYHPILLGAVNHATGNKPPATLPAKAKYGMFDLRRAIARVGNPPVQMPEDFFGHAVTVVPLRAMHYIKQHYPSATFETVVLYLFDQYWAPPNVNLTKLPAVAKALSEVPVDFRGHGTASGGKLLFTPADVEAIIQGATSQEIKDALKASTQEALDHGAFGAPWLWVTNSKGVSEPFFGSDRFHFVFKYLELPFQEIALLAPGQGESKL
ncbi:thioredoxin-like protein [Thozetella sp. PMI_491]|nr:thioredoxin-like protein [Thozetella sp. PMI_491]